MPRTAVRKVSCNSRVRTPDTNLCAVNKSSSHQVPIDVAYTRANRVQCKPEHQVLRTVPSINGDHFSNLHAQVVHEPIAHPGDCLEELSVRPCLTLKDQEWVVRSIAQSLVFQDVVRKDSLLHDPVSHKIENIWRRSKTTAGMLQIVYDVELRVEVGGECRCASCSCSDH